MDIFGMIGFTSAVIGLIPQVYKAYRTKSTRDVAMVMLLNFFIGSSAWVIYGYKTNDPYLMWSNVLAFVVTTITISQKIYYDGKINAHSRND